MPVPSDPHHQHDDERSVTVIGKVEERLRHLAWLPVLLLLAAIIVLRAMNLRDSYGSSHLLLSLNVVFFTLTSLGIVFLMGRSFLILGRPGLLLLGCGVLIWGVAGPVAVAADPDNVNIQITIHNICVWLAALCHLAGVVFSLRSHRTLGATGWWLGVSYLLTLVAVGVVMLVTLTGWLPTFFVQGQGGTLVRYVVLGSAIAIFGQSAVLLRFTNRPSPFADWYALSLWLIAVGLFGIMLQSSAGSVLGWVGRAAQYLGGVCMFIAALAVLRTSGIPVISLATRIHEIRYAYIIAIIIVLVATVVRLVFLSVLGTAVPFVLFFPAVVLAALYGGLRAGVLATLLSVIVTDFFWMNPPMTFANWLGEGLFVLSGVLISWVTEAMHHAQARAHDAEVQASIAAARLQDQQALRESRNDMDRAQEVGQIGSWRLDVRRNILTWSAENHRIFGISRGTPLSYETFLGTIHPDDRHDVDTQWQAGLRGEPYDIEHRIVVGGQVKWVREKAFLEFDDAGILLGGFGITQDITERKQAEEALAAAHRQLQNIIDNMPAIVYAFDLDERFVLANATLAELLNSTPERMHSKRRHEFMPKVDADWHEANDRLVVEAGRALEFEEYSWLNDRPITWLTMKFPLYDAQGRIYAVAGISTDISERKQAEEALRESQQQFAALIQNVESGVAQIDAHGHFTIVNPQFLQLFGLEDTPDNILNVNSQDWSRWQVFNEAGALLHVDAHPVRKAALTGQAVRNQLVAVQLPSGGDRIWMLVSAEPILKADGGIDQIICTYHDITDLKQAEEERERLLATVEHWAAELDATLAAIADGLIIYDARGTVTRINETAKVITGHPDGETPITLAEQVAIVRLERPDGTPFPLERLPATRALRGEMVTGEIIVTRHPDRAYWLSVSAAPIHDNDGALIGAVLTFTDITALHELQEQQRILLHLVSHDLRTPLAVVSGHAELVEERVNRLGIDGDVGFSLQAIRRGIRRMNVMVEDLTDMARAEGGQLQLKCQSVALRPFVTELLERSQTALDTARVRLEVDETLPPVLADPDRLDRIITNLLSNALKYGEADSPVTIAARQEDGTVAIAITDQGFGIAPGELSRLFQRFYRAPSGRKAEGIGLGLYITRLLVEAHGGAIRVVSTPGQGSTFTVTLPVAGSRE